MGQGQGRPVPNLPSRENSHIRMGPAQQNLIYAKLVDCLLQMLQDPPLWLCLNIPASTAVPEIARVVTLNEVYLVSYVGFSGVKYTYGGFIFNILPIYFKH